MAIRRAKLSPDAEVNIDNSATSERDNP